MSEEPTMTSCQDHLMEEVESRDTMKALQRGFLKCNTMGHLWFRAEAFRLRRGFCFPPLSFLFLVFGWCFPVFLVLFFAFQYICFVLPSV